MPRIVAMVPARAGSKRVPKKNLRYIGGKPLVRHVLDTLRDTSCFDAIYLNSEDTVFEAFCDDRIQFYKRDPELASDSATNDDFALDFMRAVGADVLIQILPTSPFISAETIERFTREMLDGGYDSLISVEPKQIGCVYDGEPINFDRRKQNPPSQQMTPVGVYATVLMGWRAENFEANMERYGAAYHGGDGNVGYFDIRGIEAIDIDREEDFDVAEAIFEGRKSLTRRSPRYFEPGDKREHAEVDVLSILKRDGVSANDLSDEFVAIQHLPEILESADYSKSWSKRLINTPSNCVTLLCQHPGEGNRLHYHPDWDEWWYILMGEWEWTIEGETKRLKKGDVVLVLRNQRHKITAVGDGPAMRMAVSRADVAHVYPDE